MYLLKNAYYNITRCKGRNILIGLIITVIMISACVALTIYKSGKTLADTYRESNPISVTFRLNPRNFKGNKGEQPSIQSLTLEEIENYGNSNYVTDYYYTLQTSLESDQLEAIDYTDMFESSNNTEPSDIPNKDRGMGGKRMEETGFPFIAYSDISYMQEFIDGERKLADGTMITKDNTAFEIVISDELASANDISVGDEISFYVSSDESKTYTFKVIGIFEDNSNIDESVFMGGNNSRNQIITTPAALKQIQSETTTTSTSFRMGNGQNISATYYLNSVSEVTSFEKELREKGLSDSYQIQTNEDEMMETVKPIEKISEISITFLIVILIVGAVILAIINMINIRDRKYEIGVLRAIGMSKKTVALQLILEVLIVAFICMIVGTGIGTVLSQPISNQMLKSELESYQEEVAEQQNNFGPGNFERPAMKNNHGNSNIEYVDHLNVQTDFLIIFQLFIVGLGLTALTGLISVVYVNRYEPNKILQNRL